MKFDEALLHAVAQCESRGIEGPFSLYCVLCDDVGADFAGKASVEMFFELDRRLRLVKGISRSGQAACAVFKAAYPAFKEHYSREEFCNFIDDVFCILTHAPRKERQSIKTRVKITNKGHAGKQRGKGQMQSPALAPAVPNIYAGIPPNVPPKYRGLWLLQQAIKKE